METPKTVDRIRSTGTFGQFPGAVLAAVGHDTYILEAEVAKLVADAEARGMERALETMKTAGDSAVTEAMGQRLCCNGQDCGCHGATVEQYLEHLIRAEASAIRRAAEETGT